MPKSAGRFSMESGQGVKIVGLFHALLGVTVLILFIVLDPVGLLCSGVPFASFQLLLLSWWLWRFPGIDSFRDRVLPISLRRQPLTSRQEDHFLRRAWRLQLIFVIVWGWIITVLFWSLATLWVLFGGCALASVFLLGGIFTAIAGWILGGAWVLHVVYRSQRPAKKSTLLSE